MLAVLRPLVNWQKHKLIICLSIHKKHRNKICKYGSENRNKNYLLLKNETILIKTSEAKLIAFYTPILQRFSLLVEKGKAGYFLPKMNISF